jgi:hypothetical protein
LPYRRRSQRGHRGGRACGGLPRAARLHREWHAAEAEKHGGGPARSQLSSSGGMPYSPICKRNSGQGTKRAQLTSGGGRVFRFWHEYRTERSRECPSPRLIAAICGPRAGPRPNSRRLRRQEWRGVRSRWQHRDQLQGNNRDAPRVTNCGAAVVEAVDGKRSRPRGVFRRGARDLSSYHRPSAERPAEDYNAAGS